MRMSEERSVRVGGTWRDDHMLRANRRGGRRSRGRREALVARVAELQLDWGAAPKVYASKGESNGTTEQAGCRRVVLAQRAVRDARWQHAAMRARQGR